VDYYRVLNYAHPDCFLALALLVTETQNDYVRFHGWSSSYVIAQLLLLKQSLSISIRAVDHATGLAPNIGIAHWLLVMVTNAPHVVDRSSGSLHGVCASKLLSFNYGH
jgi:uncharacterized membrane protein